MKTIVEKEIYCFEKENESYQKKHKCIVKIIFDETLPAEVAKSQSKLFFKKPRWAQESETISYRQ